METMGMVPTALTAAMLAAVLLFTAWRMPACHRKRNDDAHAELRDAITAAETRLATRADRRHRRKLAGLRFSRPILEAADAAAGRHYAPLRTPAA